MSKVYRLEDDLLKKSRPRVGSRRYMVLQKVCFEKGLWPTVDCEFCGTYLINPLSILIHQGGYCQNKKQHEK